MRKKRLHLTIPTHESAINFVFNADVSEVVCKKVSLKKKECKASKSEGTMDRLLTHWHTFNLILLVQSNSFGAKTLKLNYPLENNFLVSHKYIHDLGDGFIHYSTNNNEKWSCIKFWVHKYDIYRINLIICMHFLSFTERTLNFCVFFIYLLKLMQNTFCDCWTSVFKV